MIYSVIIKKDFFLKLSIFNMTKKIKVYLYHKSHKKSALEALSVIEKENGKLSSEIISQCDEYAKNYLGSVKYAPWLYVYSAMQGEFKKGWIPDNYYGERIVGDMRDEFVDLSSLNHLSNRVLSTKKLPDLLYYNDGLFICPDSYNIVSSEEAYKLLFNNNEKVIFKINNSSQGRGIRFYDRNNWSVDSSNLENGVFQKIIKQHDFFDGIFPHPGATVRITTELDSTGRVAVRAAYLRLGRSNNNSLSKHVQCSNEVKVAINLETGELFETGLMSDWSSIKFHPDTNVKFKGLIIPGFSEACLEVEKLHSNYPFIACLGWDVSINNECEVEVMEWNGGHNEIKFSEAIHGPCFVDLLSYANKKL